jgi:hypothetical protein
MKYVHLFFLKKLGCYISAHDVPAALSSLADVIKNKKNSSKVYLLFAPSAGIFKIDTVFVSELQTYSENGGVNFATFNYTAGQISVNVMYSNGSAERISLVDSWHPHSKNSKKIIMKDPLFGGGI